MKNSIIFFILFACCFSCRHRSKVNDDSINYVKQDSTVMNERYDYESTDGGKKSVYIEQNGWVIYKSSGDYYDMYPPPEFYKIVKIFYPNGNIEAETKFIGGVEIDTTRYYNEAGYLVKEVYENKKFGAIKPEHILKFLERAGWIDLKTGKGRTIIKGEGSKLIEYEKCVFELRFEPVGESKSVKNNKVPIWIVFIPNSSKENKWEETTYIIDGETGQVLKKEVEEKEMPLK